MPLRETKSTQRRFHPRCQCTSSSSSSYSISFPSRPLLLPPAASTLLLSPPPLLILLLVIWLFFYREPQPLAHILHGDLQPEVQTPRRHLLRGLPLSLHPLTPAGRPRQVAVEGSTRTRPPPPHTPSALSLLSRGSDVPQGSEVDLNPAR